MSASRATLNSHLSIELFDSSGHSEKMELTLVPDNLADFSRGLLGQSTPLGKTLIDQPEGAMLAYPVGDLTAVRILSISLTDQEELNSSAGLRQHAANFAASFSGKWGDYDPDGLDKWDQDSDKQGEDEDKSDSA
jgi:hypothetical protein